MKDAKPTFELRKPPRKVPGVTRRKMMFGGVLNIIGWSFAGLGLIVFAIFGMDNEFWNVATFSGSTDYAKGTIVSVEETGASENEQVIYKVRYQYTVEGRAYRGRSFGTSAYFDAGEMTSIEYLESNPAASRIEGMRRYRFSAWAMFVVIFPLVGIIIVAIGMWRGRRALYILRHGVPTMGRMTSKVETGTRVNERPLYKVSFQYEDAQGRARNASIRTLHPDKVADDAERLLYNPKKPGSIVLVDTLPGNVRVDDSGRFQASGLGLHYLLAPVATSLVLVVMLLVAL